MNIRRTIASVGLVALMSLAGCQRDNEPRVTPTSSTNRTDSTNTQPDNTGRNEVDRTGDTKTPFDQSESSSAIKITADIRRAIMDDDSMSFNAQNCKIMTDKSGVVTLRGVVNSQAEKNSIDAMAKATAGVARVDNQLEIKTN